jgi:ubiquinone/menaquinone biosynthesis C-methylase UbiE
MGTATQRRLRQVAKFDPKHIERLLSPERYQWHDPDMILDALALVSGMTFADVGAGPGFFTLPAAKRVGPAGKVYALDVEPKMLERLLERASTEGITNIEGLLSEEERLPLPDSRVDAVLLANVLHEVSEQVSLLCETARVMRPGGMLAVVEWRKRKMDKGPSIAERLSYQEVARALREAGFKEVKPFGAGPYHYGVRARKRESEATG